MGRRFVNPLSLIPKSGRTGHTIKKSLKTKLMAVFLSLSLFSTSIPPAHAIFGIGDIVLDPSNLAQNVLTATRTLRMIQNQINQLSNQRRMLLDMARHSMRLPFSVAGDLSRTLGQIDSLMRSARGLAFHIGSIERAYADFYPEQYDAATVTRVKLVGDALERWRLSREAFSHSLQVQARVVQAVEEDGITLGQLMGYSAGAEGQLQVAQTGNQLLALNTKQLMQSQSLMAAHYKAVSLDKARQAMAAEQIRARFTSFVGDRATYTRLP